MRGVSIEQQSFDRLLKWLDIDREQAGERYELLYTKLVALFEWWSCPSPQDLADRTLDRAAVLLQNDPESSAEQPYSFLRRIARYIFLEDLHEREKEREAAYETRSTRSAENARELETRLNCMERCMLMLPPESRELITRYYAEKGRTAMEIREQQAKDLRITPIALRIRICRIRQELMACIGECRRRREAARNISVLRDLT
jgi:DNA-directed RNA polymerase specialized sigma24 family protein